MYYNNKYTKKWYQTKNKPFQEFENYKITDEYIDSIFNQLAEWALETDSWILSQFYVKAEIGYTLFSYLKYKSPKLNNLYELVISHLHVKWFRYGWGERDKLPHHKEKMLSKYLRIYDPYQIEIETKKAQDVAREKVEMEKRLELEYYARENYSTYEITPEPESPKLEHDDEPRTTT